MERPGKGPTQRTQASIWLRLAVVVISPVIALTCAEVVLRLSGYGLPTRFFVPFHLDGRHVYIPNLRYCEHFVPKALSRAPESSLLGPKEPNVIRIFVFGGSAANGDPEPAYGFCRQLELLLNDRATGKSFQVINVAVTAMNSFVARRIAKDCADHKPDIFLVYMGNNEVVGPWGPTSLPGWLYRYHWFINGCITLQKDLRIGQLMRDLGRRLAWARTTQRWQGMEGFLASAIRHDDPRLQYCYRHFEDNLKGIVRTGLGCGAKVLICTVPTNVVDCPPFRSTHRPGLTEAQIRQFDASFGLGRSLEQAGEFEKALEQYQKAYEIDDTHADLVYCMGRCLLRSGRVDQAKAYLLRAQDLDNLRFRADTVINRIIRSQADRFANMGAGLVDLQACLEQTNKGLPLGSTFLWDHVHLTVLGNFYAAMAAMEAIGKIMPEAGLMPVDRPKGQLFSQLCNRMLYDLQEQYRLTGLMYYRKTRPPFAGQIDHDLDLASMGNELIALRKSIKSTPMAGKAYQQTCANYPEDHFVVLRYGEFLVGSNRIAEAIDLYQGFLKTRPFEKAIRIRLAEALASAGAEGQAVAVLTDPHIPFHCATSEALELIGACYARQGRYAEALDVYKRLSRMRPADVPTLVNLASAASHIGDHRTAREALEKATRMDPNSAPALVNMGNLLLRQGLREQAHVWFERALAADPYNYIPRFSLGLARLNQGLVQEGIKLVTDAVHLQPDLVQGYDLLAKAYSQIGKADLASYYAELRQLFSP